MDAEAQELLSEKLAIQLLHPNLTLYKLNTPKSRRGLRYCELSSNHHQKKHPLIWDTGDNQSLPFPFFAYSEQEFTHKPLIKQWK